MQSDLNSKYGLAGLELGKEKTVDNKTRGLTWNY
jgi:hypothetical protein